MKQKYLRPSESGPGYTLVRNNGESYLVPSNVVENSSFTLPDSSSTSGVLEVSKQFVRNGEMVRSAQEVKDPTLLEKIIQQVAALTLLSPSRES